jgi:cytochrome c oxidase subunit 2
MSLSSRAALLIPSSFAFYADASLANYTINMPVGVTDISHNIYQLHMIIFWICVVIGIIVFGLMFYAIIFHRKAAGYKAAQFHESTRVEICGPLFLLSF